RLPPDQRQDSAVTYVALCVVSATVIKKRFFIAALSVRNGMPTQSIGMRVNGVQALWYQLLGSNRQVMLLM
ncbi:hypothetical protein AO073_24980, partial [Pseudomonas syringae ICMP 11293]